MHGRIAVLDSRDLNAFSNPSGEKSKEGPTNFLKG